MSEKKPFLVKTFTDVGDYGYRSFHIVNALNEDDARVWTMGSIFYNEDGVDHSESMFGWGAESGSTTHLTSVNQISGEVASQFRRLGVIDNTLTVNDEILERVREGSDDVGRPAYEILQSILVEEAEA